MSWTGLSKLSTPPARSKVKVYEFDDNDVREQNSWWRFLEVVLWSFGGHTPPTSVQLVHGRIGRVHAGGFLFIFFFFLAGFRITTCIWDSLGSLRSDVNSTFFGFISTSCTFSRSFWIYVYRSQPRCEAFVCWVACTLRSIAQKTEE